MTGWCVFVYYLPPHTQTERIRERNGALNAFVVLCEERAMKEAQWQTEQLKNGRHMPILVPNVLVRPP